MKLLISVLLLAGVSGCNFYDERAPEDGARLAPPAPQVEKRAAPTTPEETSPPVAGVDDPSSPLTPPVDAPVQPPVDAPVQPPVDAPVQPPIVVPPREPTFADVQTAVFEPMCVMCHEGANAGDGVVFTSYDAVMSATAILGEDGDEAKPLIVPGDPESSVLYLALKTDWMPYFSDPLSDDAKELVRSWIAAGANP